MTLQPYSEPDSRAVLYALLTLIALNCLSLLCGARGSFRLDEQAALIQQLQERRIVDELKEIRKTKAPTAAD